MTDDLLVLLGVGLGLVVAVALLDRRVGRLEQRAHLTELITTGHLYQHESEHL